jgi:hypothetical protein
MTEYNTCRHCNEEIHKTPGGHWIHKSLEAQVGKEIHGPQPLIKMVENDGVYFKNTDPRTSDGR